MLEPKTRYVHNWHIDAICDHLEAVTDGRVHRLLITVPPGSMKSLLVSVFWPAWEWGPCGLRSLRYVATAFNDDPVLRDAGKSLNLLQSEWYRSLWPEVVLTKTAVTAFDNSSTGSRKGVAFPSLTSQRGDRLILDDPHSTTTADSDDVRVKTVRQFREGALNRLNDPEKSAIVVIMQRLHEEDVAGTILSMMDYVHLMLPMEFEPERACETSIGFKDPRTYDGELLDPERWPRPIWEQFKKETTAYALASQYQQRPSPREGNMFKRAWFADKFVNNAPGDCRWVRHWDLAGTKKSSAARTAGVKIGQAPDGRFYVASVIKVQEEGAPVRKMILATAQAERHVEISLPQDPGQSGKVQAQDYVAMLAGFIVSAQPETGEKPDRAKPFAAQCEIGNVFIVKGEWNESYLDELCLARGTLIATMRGDVPIENVQRGDMVMTRKGWRPVRAARCTNERATLCQIQLSNGSTLSCTLNHPILVIGSNFKKAGHLRAGDRLLQFTGDSFSRCSLALRSDISQERLKGEKSIYTGSFGSVNADQSHLVIRSITSMRMSGTIRSVISNASRLLNIGAGILGNLKKFLVSFAAPFTSQLRPAVLGLVPRFAPTNTNWRKAISTFTTSRASNAAQYSTHSILPKGFAASLVVNSISILPGDHPVFNLEVDDAHEFVAGGVLVHNCNFPSGKFKDQVDASSGAFGRLVTGVVAPIPLFGTYGR